MAPPPAEMLASDKFQTFLNDVRAAYDIVVLDTPPLLPVVDTLELVPLVDGVVLCVRASRTTASRRVREGRARETAREPLGLMVTGVRRGDEQEYGYYSYAYGPGTSSRPRSPARECAGPARVLHVSHSAQPGGEPRGGAGAAAACAPERDEPGPVPRGRPRADRVRALGLPAEVLPVAARGTHGAGRPPSRGQAPHARRGRGPRTCEQGARRCRTCGPPGGGAELCVAPEHLGQKPGLQRVAGRMRARAVVCSSGHRPAPSTRVPRTPVRVVHLGPEPDRLPGAATTGPAAGPVAGLRRPAPALEARTSWRSPLCRLCWSGSRTRSCASSAGAPLAWTGLPAGAPGAHPQPRHCAGRRVNR